MIYNKDNVPDMALWGALEFKEYRKKTLTKICRIDGPFSVHTREGIVDCPDGYLALDSAGFPYPIAAEEFDAIYSEAVGMDGLCKPKSLHNCDADGAEKNVPDIRKYGNPDQFVCICKASSESEGWMKSTKAMDIPGSGVLVQVSTQQKNPDGTYVVAEALAFIPNAYIAEDKETGERRIQGSGWYYDFYQRPAFPIVTQPVKWDDDQTEYPIKPEPKPFDITCKSGSITIDAKRDGCGRLKISSKSGENMK